jgi:hypothetical protein
MNKRAWLFCLMAGLVLPASFQRAVGQGRPLSRSTPAVDPRSDSHVPIPGAVGDPDQAQQFLIERLHRAENLSKLEKMLQDPELRRLAQDVAKDPEKFGMTRQDIEKLARQLGAGKDPGKPDLSDPNWQKFLDKAVKQQSKEGQPDAVQPELRERWEKLRKDLQLPRETPGDDEKPTTELPDVRPGGPKPVPQPPVTPPPGPAPAPPQDHAPEPRPDHVEGPQPIPPAAKPPQEEAQSKFTKELMDFAARLGGKNGLLEKSPAMRDALRDLSRTLETDGKHSLVTDRAKGLGDRLPGLGNYFHLDRPDLGKTLLSKAPDVHLGKNGLGVSAPAAWQGSPVGASTAAGVGALQVLVWLAVLVVVGVLLWRLLAWRQARAAAAAGWRLGPWPIHPAAVRTRGDLVRAFEYLSLLLLGRTALTWNHLEIAARLSTDPQASQGNAAARLAYLYEQARYAPPAEVLPDAELAAARRHLCLLAGVPAA